MNLFHPLSVSVPTLSFLDGRWLTTFMDYGDDAREERKLGLRCSLATRNTTSSKGKMAWDPEKGSQCISFFSYRAQAQETRTV